MPFDPPPDDIPLYVTEYSGTATFSGVSGAENVTMRFSLAWMTNESAEGLDELFQSTVDAVASLPGFSQIQASKSVGTGYGQNCTPTPPPEESTQ